METLEPLCFGIATPAHHQALKGWIDATCQKVDDFAPVMARLNAVYKLGRFNRPYLWGSSQHSRVRSPRVRYQNA